MTPVDSLAATSRNSVSVTTRELELFLIVDLGALQAAAEVDLDRLPL
jgi:hypothetical protein